MNNFKLFLSACVLMGLAACITQQPGGTTPPNPVTTTTLPAPPVDVEPASHEQALAITAEGLKVGGCYAVSEQASVWTFAKGVDFSPQPPACGSSKPLAGTECNPSSQSGCMADGGAYSCSRGKKLFKCFGWVYDDMGNTQKPLEGVQLDIFWFAGCIVGACDPMGGPVFTDKYGYFEVFTSTLIDTLRIKGKPGYYGVCNGSKPMDGGGTAISALGNGAIGERKKYPAGATGGAFKQYQLKPDSCK